MIFCNIKWKIHGKNSKKVLKLNLFWCLWLEEENRKRKGGREKEKGKNGKEKWIREREREKGRYEDLKQLSCFFPFFTLTARDLSLPIQPLSPHFLPHSWIPSFSCHSRKKNIQKTSFKILKKYKKFNF